MPETIEAEVISIDGASPPPGRNPVPEAGGLPPWSQMRGRVAQLDTRWWPLWLVLGAIALVLALTVGVVFGLIYLVLKGLVSLLRLLAAPFGRA